MRAEYKRDVSHNYLILESQKEADTASYQVRMLAGNVIPAILHCRLQNLDGKQMFYYEITSRQALFSYYEEKMFTAKDLRMLFRGFAGAVEQMAEYLMNPEQLLIRPEYIYLDIEKKEVFFCCLPGEEREVQAQLRDLMEYLLPKLDHEDQEAVLLGYGVYRKILEPGFQLEDIKEAIYHEEQKVHQEPPVPEREPEEPEEAEERREILEDEDFMKEEKTGSKRRKTDRKSETGTALLPWMAGCGAAILLMGAVLAASLTGYLPWIPAEKIMGFGAAAFGAGGFAAWAAGKRRKKQDKTAPWKEKVKKEAAPYEPAARGGDELPERIQKMPQPEKESGPREEIFGETVALSAGFVSGPASLVSREPGELATIYLDREFTVVGKMPGAADAVIPVPTVSRVHARIREKDGEYYLADLNSRNGTSVNGTMLQNEEEYRLQDEDEVDFAQARYVFVK